MKDEEINDEEYKAAVEAFYKVYKPARKKYNLRMASHFSLFDDDWIEVTQWQYDRRVAQIFKVKEEGAIEVWKRATAEIQNFVNKMKMEEQRHG